MWSLLLLTSWCVHSKPLHFEVLAGSESCIYEEYAAGENIEFVFEVTGRLHPNAMDIELNLYGPQHNLMLQRRATFKPELIRPDTGRVSMQVGSSGTHRICFNNKFSKYEPKIMKFQMKGSKSGSGKHYDEMAKLSHLGPMAMSIIKIERQLEEIEEAQERTKNREYIHRAILKKSGSHIMYATMVETLILLVVSVFQIKEIRGWKYKTAGRQRI